MEIVFNFEKKELVVNEDCSYVDLDKKLRKLLGDDLHKWAIKGRDVQWINHWWPTYVWPDKQIIAENPYSVRYEYIQDSIPGDPIICLADYYETDKEAV